MTRKGKWFAVIPAAAILAAAFYINENVYSVRGNRVAQISVSGRIVRAEIVSSRGKLEKGLGGRKGLCENCGMLFVFPEAGKHAFWMKDMRLPLDIVWIAEGKIAHIEKNIEADDPGRYAPEQEADKVLEVNAGMAEKLGWQVGDKAEVAY